MKLFLVIKPWDYTHADVEIFKSELDANLHIRHGKEDNEANSEYWFIKEAAISASPKES